MKSLISFALVICLVAGAAESVFAQTPDVPATAATAPVAGDATQNRANPGRVNPDRVSFMLKNTLGYHRMFRVEGPGIAYGFTMNRRETVPCNWPVGSKLYFSNDGETVNGLILTVTSADAGKTLATGDATADKMRAEKPAADAAQNKVTFVLHSTSLLPRKVTLISYEPGSTGNGTSGFMLGTKGNRTCSFPVGTKLYIANSDQVDVVMSGKRIDGEKPFLIVKKEDAGRVVNLD